MHTFTFAFSRTGLVNVGVCGCGATVEYLPRPAGQSRVLPPPLRLRRPRR